MIFRNIYNSTLLLKTKAMLGRKTKEEGRNDGSPEETRS